MVEKNYDPDNDNCPEKDTIENLYLQKQSEKNNNIQTVEEFIDDSPNRTSKKIIRTIPFLIIMKKKAIVKKRHTCLECMPL